MTRDPRLAEEARAAITDPRTVVAVSAASAWEISIKHAAGKLDAPTDLDRELRRHRFVHLPIRVDHAIRAGSLPLHHRDPFDRMLVAQAEIERLTLVTRDPRLPQYGIATMAA